MLWDRRGVCGPSLTEGVSV